MIVKTLVTPYIKGLHLGTYTYMFSHILDHTISKDDMFSLMKKNPLLFNQCAKTNFINLIGVTPFYYVFVDNFLLVDKTTFIQPLKIISMLLIHNVLFYLIHMTFHKFKNLYYMHKFHHRFTQPIPSSGNAVTLDEYNIAYVSPFLIAAFLIKPNDISFRITIGIVTFLNALIHCIPLSDLSIGQLFIKPGDHIEHHEKLVVKYAAPLLNIDFIVKTIKERIQRYNLYRIKGSHI